jgi:hypothetical protein
MSMEEKSSFEQTRADLEAKQKAVLWEDQFRNNRSITDFLWHGDPNAKPVQRAALILFGVLLLLYSAIAVLTWFEKQTEDRSLLSFAFALVALMISARLFCNAFRHSPKSAQNHDESDSD